MPPVLHSSYFRSFACTTMASILTQFYLPRPATPFQLSHLNTPADGLRRQEHFRTQSHFTSWPHVENDDDIPRRFYETCHCSSLRRILCLQRPLYSLFLHTTTNVEHDDNFDYRLAAYDTLAFSTHRRRIEATRHAMKAAAPAFSAQQ